VKHPQSPARFLHEERRCAALFVQEAGGIGRLATQKGPARRLQCVGFAPVGVFA
jgi:hypothetical protein